MKMITVKYLPPVAVANLIALFNIFALLAETVIHKAYLHSFFGPEARMAGHGNPSLFLLILQYVAPIVIAWVVGFLFAAGYNAIVRSHGGGFRMEIDE